VGSGATSFDLNGVLHAMFMHTSGPVRVGPLPSSFT